MRVHSIHLENFCQHSDLRVDLMPGLNMLAGPNGSGKTNILRALQLALTGDAGGGRNKLDDIYQGMAEGTHSSVTADLSHAGASISICRSLKPSTNSMTVGDQSFRGVGEINTELWQRLGVSKRQITDYIFVGQRKIDSLFDQKPADRAASLSALFGIDQAERIWKAVGDFEGHITIPSTALDADAIRLSLATNEQTAEQLAGQIVALDLPEDIGGYISTCSTIVSGWEVAETALADLRKSQLSLASKELLRQPLETAIARKDAAVQELNDAIEAIQPAVDAAEAKLQQWTNHDAAKAAYTQYETASTAFNKKWPRPPVLPLEPPAIKLRDDEVAHRSSLLADLQQYEQGIKTLQSVAAVCTTCGQAMPEADIREQQLAKQIEMRDDTAINLKPFTHRKNLWDAYDVAHTAHVNDMQAYTTEQQRLVAQSQALQSLDPPEESREQLTEVVKERVSYCRAVDEMAALRWIDAESLAETTGELSQLTTQVTQLQEKYDALPKYAAEQASEASSNLRDIRAKHGRALGLQQQLAVANAGAGRARMQLHDISEVNLKAQRTREVADHFAALRNIFHRNESPRMVAYTYIEAMLGEVNNTLELFDAPFRVEMDESLGFTARFLDGVRVQPDSRLSVGERIVLAMAFRITVNSTFAGQVGVLILDEPTAGLDEHNLGCLPRALERLRVLSHERGLQILFVTHEPRIGHLFDNIIELPAA